MPLFEKLYDLAETPAELDLYLNNNVQSLYDYINCNYSIIKKDKDSIERFILLRVDSIRHLDFHKSHNKAFISILIELCERLSFPSAFVQVYTISKEANIFIGSRLQVAALYLINPDCNSRFIEWFDKICDNIQASIDQEDDDEKKSLATFLNFYSHVVYNTNIDIVNQIKSKAVAHIRNAKYRFLSHDTISNALAINVTEIEVAFLQFQDIIDDVLGKTPPEYEYESEVELLIEEDSDYADLLHSTKKNLKSVRNISVRKYNEIENKNEVYHSLGRGVSILQNEEQLFTYMNSFGNSHIAKIGSALEIIDFSEINNDIEIIDWGCGQGIASLMLFEHLESLETIYTIRYITLIEPSTIALKRAALHIKYYNQTIGISTICKKFDSIAHSDIVSNPSCTKIHLLSNILDVESFSLSHLIDIITNSFSSSNYFICVSPFITDIKADRVDSFKRNFENNCETYRFLGGEQNTKNLNNRYWNCNNNYNGNMGVFCRHPECGCENKWTRVLRVFHADM